MQPTSPRLLLILLLCLACTAQADTALERDFAHPPDSAKPWVYWFWSNGNVTKQGITADLEAMKRVGIGGVLIMDVVERFAPPPGPAKFMSDQWRDDFQFAVSEANRLGIEINMTNGPGWCGSSGPWITPDMSMQKLVLTETKLTGPTHFDAVLPKADVSDKPPKDSFDSFVSTHDFYRDVAVIAFPDTANGVIPDNSVVNLTDRMTPDGKLTWDAPAGNWIVQRIGHASTGSSTRPPVLGGNGLECDKLNPAAMDIQFAGMMQKLIDRAGPIAAKTLVATHIDSWEVGSQNWTDALPAEFKKRRGYDLIPFLAEYELPRAAAKGKPAPIWRHIGSRALGDRFRWDFYQTIGELLAENYTGRIATLAHQHGMRFTLEGYELPFGDEATYTAAADEPMTEFWRVAPWAQKFTQLKAREMASVAHVYGRPVVGAESFTSDDNEKWLQTPATLKSLGDYEFSQGVNRFVFHRYAHQPWLDRAPGATMGPWGLHYERTNTWWEMSTAWHQYLARCQQMLREGKYVADLLYLRTTYPNQTYFTPAPAVPEGYRYDEISDRALVDRVTVKDGRLVLPDGMSYRLLVLPPDPAMTPEVARKIRQLVDDGAAIYGPAPDHSPSLQDYPACDKEIATFARELWGPQPKAAVDYAFGRGKVFANTDLASVLTKLNTPADFTSSVALNWIHRHLDDAEVYFLANPTDREITVDCNFRTPGLRGERWNPQTGECFALADGPLHFGPTESAFIVFRPASIVSSNLSKPIGPTQQLAEINGPWNISFPPKLGAPEHATFDKLISWSDSPEEGIQHFSGTATYTTHFKVDKPVGRVLLDLGDVQVMARVKLNGRDLGILWMPPYRAEVSDALHAGDNELEVAVVNLWPNRMIGDAALPEDKRVSWSTWTPFKPNTPLLRSGLLGPVRLMGER